MERPKAELGIHPLLEQVSEQVLVAEQVQVAGQQDVGQQGA